jgi:hypothetical protein
MSSLFFSVPPVELHSHPFLIVAVNGAVTATDRFGYCRAPNTIFGYAAYRLLFIKRQRIIQYGEHFSSIKPNHTTNFFVGLSFKCSCRHINYYRLNIMTDLSHLLQVSSTISAAAFQ